MFDAGCFIVNDRESVGLRSKCCFTLIELLVVVAIIAVLIAILLPALGRAREGAKIAVCCSKLRQIGSAYQMYHSDYNDRGPLGQTEGQEATRDTGWSLANPSPYRGNLNWGWYSGHEGKDVDGNVFHALGTYVFRSGSIVKDEGKGSQTVVACPNLPERSHNKKAGYSVNGYLGYDTYLGDHVEYPSTTPMLMCPMGNCPGDDVKFFYVGYPDNLFGWMKTGCYFMQQATINHVNGSDFLFFDGHAVFQTPLKNEKAYLDKWTWSGS